LAPPAIIESGDLQALLQPYRGLRINTPAATEEVPTAVTEYILPLYEAEGTTREEKLVRTIALAYLPDILVIDDLRVRFLRRRGFFCQSGNGLTLCPPALQEYLVPPVRVP
jgi:hypothetical protein